MSTSTYISDLSEQELKVVNAATGLFLSKGIRTVTLDNIAGKLGMSKKTIYAIFGTKAELVHSCVRLDLQKRMEEISVIQKQNYDAVEEMLQIGKKVSAYLRLFSVNILEELSKFYPQSWQSVERYKDEVINKIILANLQKGKESGLYRQNLNEKLVAHIFMSFMDSAMMQHSVLKTKASLNDIYSEHLLMHMYAICSEDGRAQLEQLLNTIRLSS